ncbi:uncharacterized protein TNCV_912271 [Trichonephila clavipes]|nr:uncharacterized protein TNCV_912271 [Trichonephila clavipes]
MPIGKKYNRVRSGNRGGRGSNRIPPHVQSSDQRMPYPTNHVQQHKNTPERLIRNHHSFFTMHFPLPYFSRKPWVVQLLVTDHLVLNHGQMMKAAPELAFSNLHTTPTGGLRASREGCGSPVVKVSDHVRHVMSSSPVPLKTCRVGQRCTLNLSRAETSSRWCGVVVKRGGDNSGVIHVT